MPELPEVETVVRQLNEVLLGRVIDGVEVLREKSAQSDLNVLVGREIFAVERVAKNIVTKFNDWDGVLLTHLKMTGQLIFDENDQSPSTKSQINSIDQNSNVKTSRVVGGHPSGDWVGELPSKHTRIMASFNDGSRLFFNDQRVFGWWKIISSQELRVMRQELPPDVVDEEFTVEYLGGVLERSGRAIKLVILDQAKMGGMGNIYANDALWMAKIYPEKPANKLKKREIEELHKAMVDVLNKGIELGGASYSHFVDTEGLGGKYQEHFLVYDREGEKCLREDGGVIEKIKLGGRGTYYCPKCQL